MASGGGVSINRYRQDLSGNSLTSTYDEAVASVTNEVTHLHYGNSSAEAVTVGLGAAGDENEIALLPALSHGIIPCIITKGGRVAIKGVGTTAVGIITLDLRQ